MHYYQHHIGDFIKDTSFLTNEEVGIYLKLLWLYYDTEQPLPNSLFELSMKVNARDQQDSLNGILNMFFTLRNDLWHHNRCDKEISHYHQQLTTASKAGKASAAKRALNRNSTGVERALDLRSTDVQPTINQEPITINHKPNKETAIAVCPVNVEEQVWADFLALRKVKKAPMTVTALAGIMREADKANWSLNRAISECVARGWTGFKAEWVEAKQTFAQQAQDIARTTVPSSSQRDPALAKLDEDYKNAKPNPEILAKIKEALKGKVA
jgi:uncharacterized protein YdaU (DUF1376 family)